MPIYEAECTVCHIPFEWYSVMVTDDTNSCPACGGKADRLFSNFVPSVFQPFVTRNILPGGVPVYVKSQGQLSSLCNEHKLNHVDDPKYQPKPFIPPDPAKVLGMQATPEGERGVDGGACSREELLA
jgi:putative FmdB family regulatory protein